MGNMRGVVFVTHCQAAKLAGFQFVNHQIIKMAQGREHQRLIARVALAGDQVKRGFIPLVAHLRQQPRAAGAKFVIRHIQAVEKQKIAEMENFHRSVKTVEGRQIQQAVGSRGVEKGALSAGIGHHLRHGGRGKGGALHALAVDVILVEHRQNVVSVAVFANQAHRLQRQANVHFCQRQQDVQRRTAGGTFAVGDFRQPAALRPLHDLVDVVHQHITCGDDALTFHYACPALPKMRICSATVSVIASSILSSSSANSSYSG